MFCLLIKDRRGKMSKWLSSLIFALVTSDYVFFFFKWDIYCFLRIKLVMTLTVSTCEIHLLSLHLPSLPCKYGNNRLFLAILSRHFSLTQHWWGVALIGVPCLSSGFFVLTAENEKNIYTGPCRLYYVFWIFFLKIIRSQQRILNRGVWCDLWSEVRIVYLSWLSI